MNDNRIIDIKTHKPESVNQKEYELQLSFYKELVELEKSSKKAADDNDRIAYVVMFHEWEVFPNKKIRLHHTVAVSFNKERAIENIKEYKKAGVIGRYYCFKNGDRFSIRKFRIRRLNNNASKK